MKPLILITNDDGIDSPGIHALAESLLPFCDLLVAAPKFQQTGIGRGALNGDQIGIIERKNLIVNGQLIKAYAINGSPAQSVAHAVLELADRKPEYCLSGVNYGENLGLSYTCSGTLGAAFEADSHGIPSIAFSRVIPLSEQKSNEFSIIDWEMEKYHIRRIFLNVLKKGMPQNVSILNVNFPTDINKETEVRVTRQAYMNYSDYVRPKQRDFSQSCSLEWQLSSRLYEVPRDTDIYAVHFDKVISVTPMTSLLSVDTETYYG